MNETIISLIIVLVGIVVLVGGWIYSKHLDKQIAFSEETRARYKDRYETTRGVNLASERAVIEAKQALLESYKELDEEQIQSLKDTIKTMVDVDIKAMLYGMKPMQNLSFQSQSYKPFWGWHL